MVSGPKGSIQLNKDDQVIAGTNLGGGGGNEKTIKYQKESIELLKKIEKANLIAGMGTVATILYSGFDAVRADNHYDTKFR